VNNCYTGLLQVTENWKKVRKFEWSGKLREGSGEIFFGGKSGKMKKKLVPPDVRFSG